MTARTTTGRPESERPHWSARRWPGPHWARSGWARSGRARSGRARSYWRAALAGTSIWPALTGLGLGLLALGPGLAPGFLLSYDMVFVPRMPFNASLLGLSGGPPRAVPSDAFIAITSLAVPGEILQKIILLLIFVLACSGAARLLPPGASATARLAAGVCYTWNPYVAERLLIGQWALLLGYAGLPWVLGVLCTGPQRIRPARLLCVLMPAAIGGFAAMAVTAAAAVPAALAGEGGWGWRGPRIRRLATVLGCLALLSLVWAVPALAEGVRTDPRGVSAFAARADTPFGRLGSLLMLSGIWNAQTVPGGYGGPASAVWLLVVIAALGGLLVVTQRRLRGGLCAGALTGLLLAAIGITSPGRAALRDLVAAWPGFAVLRDGQQFLAPLALAEACGLGALVTWIAARAGRDAGQATVRAGAALGVMAVLAPVVLLPGLAWGMAGRLRAAEYPADWSRAEQLIDGDPAPGTVLLLPWGAYRRYPWNGGEAVFDPWSRLLAREVIWDDGLQVGPLSLAQESPDSERMNRIVTRPGPLTWLLRAAGVRYVIVDAGPLLIRSGSGLAAEAKLPGARVAMASRNLVIFRLPGPDGGQRGRALRAQEYSGRTVRYRCTSNYRNVTIRTDIVLANEGFYSGAAHSAGFNDSRLAPERSGRRRACCHVSP